MRNLKQLHLYGQEYTTVAQLEALMRMLEVAHQLEDLVFTGVGLSRSIETADRTLYHAHVPHLKRLQFDNVQANIIRTMLTCVRTKEAPAIRCVVRYQPSLMAALPDNLTDLTGLRSPIKFRLSLYYHECAAIVAGGSASVLIHLKEVSHQLRTISLEFADFTDHAEEMWIDGTGVDLPSEQALASYINILEGAPDVKKLVLNLSRERPLRAWITALGGQNDHRGLGYIPCPWLSELHICMPLHGAFEDLKKVLGARSAKGYSLDALYIYFPTAPDAQRLELNPGNAQAIFDDWIAAAPAQLRSLTGKVEFIHTESLPSMSLPASNDSGTINRDLQILSDDNARLDRSLQVSGLDATPVGLDLDEIDRKATSLLKHIRFIRNATQPIMRLPREVFAIIFKIVQESHLNKHRDDEEDDPSRKWMRMAHVCQHWRDIVLSCPALWSDILLSINRKCGRSSVGCFRFFLHNARQTSLRVILEPVVNEGPYAAAILQHLASFRELVFRHSGLVSSETQDVLERSPAPSLEVLTIGGYSTTILPLGTQFLSLFGGVSPKLRYVRVDRSIILATNFRNLRQLHLYEQEYTRHEFNLLLDTLNASPLMEDLTFTGTHVTDTSTAIENSLQRFAHLVELKRLVLLHLEPEDVRLILSHLHLGTNVALTCEHDWVEYEDFRSLLPSNLSRLDNLNGLTKFRISLHNKTCAIVAASDTSAFLVRDFDNSPNSINALHVEWVDISKDALELWVDGCDPHGNHGLRQYIDILVGTPDIRKLTLNLVDSISLLGWLNALGGGHSPGYLPCPWLRELHVCGPYTTNVMQKLVETLNARKDGGHPLETLYLYLPLVTSVGRDEDMLVRLKVLFDEWMALSPSQLLPLVSKVEFVRSEILPCMALPAVCTTPGTGRWQWPVWTDELWTTPVEGAHLI
ncbi:hypothetical protein EIP86_006123 [Pleurotus ostreatoroseus]|nr:hypothetical protein EIP86_006123 [Pleurotus ostreatoroseus]